MNLIKLAVGLDPILFCGPTSGSDDPLDYKICFGSFDLRESKLFQQGMIEMFCAAGAYPAKSTWRMDRLGIDVKFEFEPDVSKEARKAIDQFEADFCKNQVRYLPGLILRGLMTPVRIQPLHILLWRTGLTDHYIETTSFEREQTYSFERKNASTINPRPEGFHKKAARLESPDH